MHNPHSPQVCTFAWLYGDGSSASGVLLSSKVKEDLSMGGLSMMHAYMNV